MKHLSKALVLTIIAAAIMATPCMAQDVEPPFTWMGDGEVSILTKEGIKDVEFDFSLTVDEQAMVSGYTSNEDGKSRLKHVFVSDPQQHAMDNFFSRKAIIVNMFNEDGDNPWISIMNGRILVDKFFYGEVLVTKYENSSTKNQVLGIDDPKVSFLKSGDIPYNLQSVLDQCLPVGTVQITGDYAKEDTAAMEEGETITLFNGNNFAGWHMWVEGHDVDPKTVWDVRDGAIWCKGEPNGFIRTTKKFDDFKLELEWKWPDNPTNSGVLVRMNDEEKTWPKSMEAQLKHERAGDVVGMGIDFNEDQSEEGSFFRFSRRQNASNEVDPGGWNHYTIICKGTTMELYVNGQFQNKATGLEVHNGYIGLQSEGSPIMFKNIKLTPLK